AEISQFATALEPGFDQAALLFTDRATLAEADETVVFTADVAQAVGLDCVLHELLDETVQLGVRQAVLEIQGQFETQLLKLVDTEFLAQTTGTVGSHALNPREY